MSRERIERTSNWQDAKPQPRPAIVFGSGAGDPATRVSNVRETCETIGLARSTYYYQSRRSASATELEHRIVLRLHELRKRFPRDGYRRLTEQLLAEGFHVNRKRIARLLQVHGLSLRTPKALKGRTRGSAHPATGAEPHAPLRITRPRQIWITDITYVRLETRVVYVAAIIDPWSRDVKGYAVSQQLNPRLASLALHAAVKAHRPAAGSVHHSTCGTQYVMRGYTELLRHYGVVPAPDDPGYPVDMTAFNCRQMSLSHNIVELPEFKTWADVVARVREFIQVLYSAEQISRILRQHCW